MEPVQTLPLESLGNEATPASSPPRRVETGAVRKPVRARTVLKFPFYALLFVTVLSKVLLRRLLASLVLVVRSTARNAILAVVMVALVAGLAYTNLPAVASRAAFMPGLRSNDTSLPVPEGVSAYVQGQLAGDANLMWSGMSESLRRSNLERGNTARRLQQRLDEAHQQGGGFREAQYVFGKKLRQEQSFFVYIFTAEVGSGETRAVPYLFTVNAEGWIERVD